MDAHGVAVMSPDVCVCVCVLFASKHTHVCVYIHIADMRVRTSHRILSNVHSYLLTVITSIVQSTMMTLSAGY